MTLNPITALSDQLQKLITEHGSAAILREHLALFKDQVIDLEKKLTISESESAVLKTENEKLKSEVANLRIANNELAAKIKEYENPPHSNLLDESKLKILTLLSKQTTVVSESDIGPSIGLSHQAALFHLEELATKYMVLRSHNLMSGAPLWSLIQNGRRYLIEHNLL